ncbi:MAG: sigma-70 family RNA polymerase sigma factor [Gammaproteobacteria bacterium]|nr:sigma-70 family RNA polymerase sigma factor [Gammaproteobacteria bacterium]
MSETATPAAAGAAWADFESRLRTYVRKRVDPVSADDVFGEVMLRLVQHREDLQAADKPVAWMLRVAANAIADRYRRREVEQRALAKMQTEAMHTPHESESHATAAAELARCLVPLIRELPAPYGEALLLTEIEGVAQNAAARQLGLSYSGMKTRVQRGRAKLKAALLRCCDVEVNRSGVVLDYRRRAPHVKCGRRCG